MSNLRNKIIRLAYAKPGLRPKLLTLLKQGSGESETYLAVKEIASAFRKLEEVSTALHHEKGKLIKGDLYGSLSRKTTTHLGVSGQHLMAADSIAQNWLAGMSPDSSGRVAAGWFNRYMRTFHPIINRIWRWVAGPMAPKAIAAVSEFLVQVQALREASKVLLSFLEEAKSRFDGPSPLLGKLSEVVVSSQKNLSSAIVQIAKDIEDLTLGQHLLW